MYNHQFENLVAPGDCLSLNEHPWIPELSTVSFAAPRRSIFIWGSPSKAIHWAKKGTDWAWTEHEKVLDQSREGHFRRLHGCFQKDIFETQRVKELEVMFWRLKCLSQFWSVFMYHLKCRVDKLKCLFYINKMLLLNAMFPIAHNLSLCTSLNIG